MPPPATTRCIAKSICPHHFYGVKLQMSLSTAHTHKYHAIAWAATATQTTMIIVASVCNLASIKLRCNQALHRMQAPKAMRNTTIYTAYNGYALTSMVTAFMRHLQSTVINCATVTINVRQWQCIKCQHWHFEWMHTTARIHTQYIVACHLQFAVLFIYLRTFVQT